jgi:hypothetical protein
MVAPDFTELRAAVFAALAPRSGAEASAMIDALDLLAERYDRDDVDRDAFAAVSAIRRRVTAAFSSHFEAGEMRKILAGSTAVSLTSEHYSHPACVWRRCPHPETCMEMDSGCANVMPKGAA